MLSLALAAQLFLTAAPTGPAQLTIELKPAGCELSVDGKKSGKSSPDKPLIVKLKPGKHMLRVVYKGDAHNEEIVVKAGEKKTWKFEFEGSGSPAPAEPTPAETPAKE